MKGMVAGEPIRSGLPSKEYEDGYNRTFLRREVECKTCGRQCVGEAGGVVDCQCGTQIILPVFRPRGRWMWDNDLKRMVPAGSERVDKRVPVVGDSHYVGLKSPIDGTDISSRRKHREYMREKGLTTADDYKSEWAQAQKSREAMLTGQPFDTKRRREQIAKAVYEAEKAGKWVR